MLAFRHARSDRLDIRVIGPGVEPATSALSRSPVVCHSVLLRENTRSLATSAPTALSGSPCPDHWGPDQWGPDQWCPDQWGPDQWDRWPCEQSQRTVLPVSIVIETTTDPELLAVVHHKTVSVAYTSYFPTDSAPPTVLELVEDWSERLADPSATAFVARTRGTVNGAVAVRADPDPDFDGEGQLTRLHVLPSEWGRGVGSALHDAAIAQLTRQRYHRAGLWVLAANTRARAMYESRHWMLRPGYEYRPFGVTEVRYGRSLMECSQERASRTE